MRRYRNLEYLKLSKGKKRLYKLQCFFCAIPQKILDRYYPVEDDTLHPGSDRDYHICYYGQILKAYIIED